MRCVAHDIAFTVYPPGWVPYGREPVVCIDHRGRFVDPDDGGSRWNGTLFAAVVDAGAGEMWPDAVTLGPSVPLVEVEAPLPRCQKTQRRHIAGAMRLFALDAAGTERDREQTCRLAGLELTLLDSAAGRIRDGPGLAARGKEGAKVLEQLPALVQTISGLLALGVRRGFWGPPLS